jgi:hypothetical protein
MRNGFSKWKPLAVVFARAFHICKQRFTMRDKSGKFADRDIYPAANFTNSFDLATLLMP